MNQATVYQYPKCTTCKKALKWLDEKQVDYTSLHIVEAAPDAATIRGLIERSGLPIKNFFNTSGLKYRELGLKDKISTLTLDEAAELLASHGMLIKRPLFVQGDTILVGFKPVQWEEADLE